MSKRSYESGSAKRKRRELLDGKLKQLPRVDTFFTPVVSDKVKATDDKQNLSNPVSLPQSSQSDSEPREMEVTELKM